MKAEDIIEGLNQFIESKREAAGIRVKGFFVLQREIIPNPTFKAYKEFKATLWYVKGSKRDRVIVVNITKKAVDISSEESVTREVNKELSIKLFELVSTNISKFILGD